jgi:hypothetical protein
MEPVINDKGFLVLKISTDDMKQYWSSPCVCDMCNCDMKENVYYIAVLNYAVCESCYNNWLLTAKNWDEDKKYERNYFIRFLNASDKLVSYVDANLEMLRYMIYMHFYITDIKRYDEAHILNDDEYYFIVIGDMIWGTSENIYLCKEIGGVYTPESIYIGKINKQSKYVIK